MADPGLVAIQRDTSMCLGYVLRDVKLGTTRVLGADRRYSFVSAIFGMCVSLGELDAKETVVTTVPRRQH